jgi:hypothetical protein
MSLKLIAEIREHHRCSSFVLSFIRLIRDEMLIAERKIPRRMDNKKAVESYLSTSEKMRIGCAELTEKLGCMVEAGEKAQDYYVDRKGSKVSGRGRQIVTTVRVGSLRARLNLNP